MKKARKGLGRGLSALIPDADMNFLTSVARGETVAPRTTQAPKKPRPSQKVIPSTKPDAQSTKSAKKPGSKRAQSKVILSKAGARTEVLHETVVSSQEELRSLAELIPLSQIEANPYQPRRTFSDEEMQELSSSIQQHGVLQPILLRPLPPEAEKTSDGIQYQLIAGERRWRASQSAGLAAIPAIVRRVTDQQALELAVIENVQRHDISALDAANAYKRLAQEFSLSQDEIAQRVGKSRVSISNTIRLLDLPIEVQKSIADGTMSEGHGRAVLLAASDGARRAVFRRLLREKLSVRATEELARTINHAEDDSGSMSDGDDFSITLKSKSHSLPEIRRLEESLQKHLGTRVRLRPRKRGGQVVIQYFSNEELERLLKTIISP